MAHVGLEGALGDEQLLHDGRAVLALGHQRQNLGFPRGEAGVLGQLGRPLVAPQLFRGLLHEAARIQDAHAPAARQLLLGQQDERGRQHHGHHRNRDDRVLGAGVHAGRGHGLGDPLTPDDEHLLGAFDGGEDDDRDPETLRDVVQKQRHDNAHERVAHGDEIAGRRRAEDALDGHEQKAAHDEHERRAVQRPDVEAVREEVGAREQHRHDDGRRDRRVHAGAGGQLVLAQPVGEGVQGQKNEDLPRVGELRNDRRGAIGGGQRREGPAQAEQRHRRQDHQSAGHAQIVQAVAEEHTDDGHQLGGRRVQENADERDAA